MINAQNYDDDDDLNVCLERAVESGPCEPYLSFGVSLST